MTVSKNSPKKPNWLPDWEDITKYPDPKKATGRVWAWEFLRRNAHYQELWEKFSAGEYADGLWHIFPRFETEFAILSPAPPSMPFTHPDFKWRPRFAAQNLRYWILPWPDDEGIGNDLDGADLDHPAEVLVKFDLRLQLLPQLKSTKAILKKEAKHLAKAGVLGGQPRARFEKYQIYLRVLDAKASSASSKEIAKEILGITNKTTLQDAQYVKEKVDEVFEPAKRLRDGGYRFLAAKGRKAEAGK
jgi:hypothetical protein